MPPRARLARSIARAEFVAWLPSRPRWPAVRPRVWLVQLVPTRRSLVVGAAVLLLGLGGYLIARESSLFAIDRIEVRGASPRVAGEVREALRPVLGRPLVGLDGSAVLRDVDALPTVVRASYDRAFPHTLRVTVVPERPAAVLREGSESWLVSARGRVLERLPASALPRLPRIWLSTHTPVSIGSEVGVAGTAAAARAVGLAGAFAARVASASNNDGTLLFRLHSGLELLLGDGTDIKLKVAVAAHVLAVLPSGSAFLDVSNPGRPVSGTGSPIAGLQQGSARG
jgi:cell division protein FtsQ